MALFHISVKKRWQEQFLSPLVLHDYFKTRISFIEIPKRWLSAQRLSTAGKLTPRCHKYIA